MAHRSGRSATGFAAGDAAVTLRCMPQHQASGNLRQVGNLYCKTQYDLGTHGKLLLTYLWPPRPRRVIRFPIGGSIALPGGWQRMLLGIVGVFFGGADRLLHLPKRS